MQLAPLALALTTLFIDGLRTGARRQKLHPRQGKGALGEGRGERCAAAPRGSAASLSGICLCPPAAQLLEKLSEYEIVTPTRVNEFGEPFPTDVHFRRRRRSTSAAPDAWTAAASPKAHYRLSAFGQQFFFNLTANSAFIAPLFTVSLLGEPAAEQRRLYAEAADADVKHCFYRGHVNARPRLTAVISLCSGMVRPPARGRASSGSRRRRRRSGRRRGRAGRGAMGPPLPVTARAGPAPPARGSRSPLFIGPVTGAPLLLRGFWGRMPPTRARIPVLPPGCCGARGCGLATSAGPGAAQHPGAGACPGPWYPS